MQNYQQTIISQYATSPTLLQLLSDWNENLDPSADIDQFYANYRDIDTAIGVGLDIWGKVLGVGRTITASQVGKYLGFAEGETAANDYQSFGFGIFYDSQSAGAYTLVDSSYRTLLKAKALGNIIDGSVISYNKYLSLLFPSNTVYCEITATMAVKITFATAPSDFEVSVLAAAFPQISQAGVQFTT